MPVRVLIVDDEATLRGNLSAFFEDEGMDVEGAGSGEEAVAMVAGGRRFDVCVMDLRLPGMDGHETIRELLRLDPAMRFLIHTGTAGYALPDDLPALGVTEDHVYLKPLPDMRVLSEAIDRLAVEPGDPTDG
jgi:CheY-like chemotaxis protein